MLLYAVKLTNASCSCASWYWFLLLTVFSGRCCTMKMKVLFANLNCKNFGMTLLCWQICKKSKSSYNLQYLQSILSNVLTFLTRFVPYLLRNTSTIDKPDGNLSLAINIKTSATTQTLAVPNDISNQYCVIFNQ